MEPPHIVVTAIAAAKTFLIQTTPLAKPLMRATTHIYLNNMKHILYLLFICVLFVSCAKKQNQLIIEGDFTHAPQAKIKLAVITEDDLVIIDSTTLKDGHFQFTVHGNNDMEKARLSTPMLYQILLSYNNTLTTLAQGGDHIVIKADAKNTSGTYRVSGSKEAELMGQLDSALAAFVQPTNALYSIYEENIDNDSIRESIEKDYIHLLNNHKTFLTDFIRKHPDNLASYVAFYQSYNRRSFFSEEQDFELLQSITKSLLNKYPNHPYLKKMKQRVEVLELIKQRKEQQ